MVPSKSAISDLLSPKNLGTCFLAAAGLLDIFAYVLPDIVNSSIIATDGHHATASEKVTGQVDQDPIRTNSSIAYPAWFLAFVRWLDQNSNSIFLLFSLLWLVDAFFSKHRRYQKALMEQERRRLTGKGNNAVEKEKWWQTPEVNYCISMTLQFFFMPVGFYLALFYSFKHITGWGDGMKDMNHLEGGPVIEEFAAITKFSVIGAIVRHFHRSAAQATDMHVELAKSKAIKRLLGRAVKNPFKFRKDLKDFLTILRWVKYVSPLIGAGFKATLNMLDMLKRRKLRAHAKRLKKAKQLIWEKGEKRKMTKDCAATIIQTAYRASLARRRGRALLLLKNEEEHRMALKLQRKFRRHLKEARERIASQQRELERLQRIWRQDAEMSDDEKRTMYWLQDELGGKARELLNRKLLLRPNTKFAVAWKAFFVVAVLREMTQAAVSPLLREGSKRGDVPATMEEFVAATFVPTHVADLAACREKSQNGVSESSDQDRPWYCQDPIARWQGAFRDAVALALIPAPVAEWPECQEKERSWLDQVLRRSPEGRKPWYCLGSLPAWHAVYRKLADVALGQFRYFMGAVMFLDVFVTFFTGQFCGTTGELVPQPWFMRWIVPGLLLQLVVNPNVADVSASVSRCLRIAAAMGAYRAYRHFMAVVVPLTCGAVHTLVVWLWLPMVSYENSSGIIESPFLKSMIPHR